MLPDLYAVGVNRYFEKIAKKKGEAY